MVNNVFYKHAIVSGVKNIDDIHNNIIKRDSVILDFRFRLLNEVYKCILNTY